MYNARKETKEEAHNGATYCRTAPARRTRALVHNVCGAITLLLLLLLMPGGATKKKKHARNRYCFLNAPVTLAKKKKHNFFLFK